MTTSYQNVDSALTEYSQRPSQPMRLRPAYVTIALALILIAAAVLRLRAVNWDAGQHLHPDERFLVMVDNGVSWPSGIGQYFDGASSPLNPYNRGFGNFVYGTLPIFILKLFGTLLHRDTYDLVIFVGRVLSAIADIGSIWLLFLAGRRLYNERVALLASAFMAFAVLGIQLSHFMAVDTFTVFFLMLSFYYVVKLMQGGGWTATLGSGFAFGLALACKLSIALVPLLIAGALLVRLIEAWPKPAPVQKADGAGSAPVIGGGPLPVMAGASAEQTALLPGLFGPSSRYMPAAPAQQAGRAREIPYTSAENSLWYAAAMFLGSLAAAAIAFRVFQPYAFDGIFKLSAKWLADETSQRNFIAGTVDIPFLLQWAHTTPIVFPIKDIVLYGMGWPLGLLSLAAVGAAGYDLLVHRKLVHLLPLLWILSNLAYLGLQQSKTMRYFYQLYPFLALLGAWLVVSLYGKRWRRLDWGLALGAFALGGTVLYALAFGHIYSQPHSRVAASSWIFDNIPAGKTLANEHWDDSLPLSLGPDKNPDAYQHQTLNLYDDDNPAKVDMIVKVLSASDYVVMSSNRLYASITRIPQRYPITTEYYKLLFGGQLGFQQVHEDTSYPSLFGVPIRDDRVMGYTGLAAQLQPDEAFTVYDHPHVLIYQKTADFSADNVRALLSAVPWQDAQRLTPKQASLPTTRMALSASDQQVDEAGGTWSALFDRASVANQAPVLAWWLAIELLGVIAFPLVFLALSRLWDGGWLLAKPAGLLLLAYLSWIVPSLHVAPYTRREIGLVLAVMIATSGLALALNWRNIREFVRRHRRRIFVAEGLFAAFFVLFFLIRSSNPDLWHPSMGGEKPMDFAFLNATLKTSYFPPYDPWFAGGYINYYYFGFVIVGTLIKLLGIVPAVGYNLAVALLPAFSAIGAFSIVASIVAWRGSKYPRAPFAFGLLAAVFVAIMGNLGDVFLIFQGLQQIGNGSIAGGLAAVIHGQALPFRVEWWYWNATREVPDVINELPFFTFLYGDLHAHAIALPYTLLAIGAAVGLILSNGVHDRVDSDFLPVWRRFTSPAELAGLALLGVVIGALKPTNTWDFPTYLVLAGACLILADIARFKRLDGRTLLRAGIKVAIVLILATVLFEPFSKSFATLYSSVQPWTGKRTDLGPYLIVHGIFLFIISCYLCWEVFGAGSRSPVGRMGRLFLRRRGRLVTAARRAVTAPRTPGRRLGLAYLSDALAMFGLVLLALAILRMWLPVVLTALLGLAALALFSPNTAAHKRLAYVFIGLGLGLSLGSEFLVLQGDVGRMNTVFKLDLQVWVLWGLASALALYDMLLEIKPWQLLQRRLVFGGATFLACCGLVYTLAGGLARAHDRFTPLPMTDDGEAYMAVSTWQDQKPIPLKPDYEAITWLQDNVSGSPVILEGRGKLYSWANRISIYTGLPTVLGWDWHEIQQRGLFGDQDIQKRAADVTNMYTNSSLDAIQPLLRQYGVRYVYVGPFEQENYPAAGLAKFDAAVPWLHTVYDQDSVKIYEVAH